MHKGSAREFQRAVRTISRVPKRARSAGEEHVLKPRRASGPARFQDVL